MRSILSGVGLVYLVLWATGYASPISLSDLSGFVSYAGSFFSHSPLANFHPFQSISQTHIMVLVAGAALFHG